MVDAFFWYTGLAFWILVAVGAITLLAADASDRNFRHRTKL
jgi:hypothetical protein